MNVHPNFKTKQNFVVDVFSPGPFPGKPDGAESVEGPHYPEPHKWYARVQVSNGRITKVRYLRMPG